MEDLSDAVLGTFEKCGMAASPPVVQSVYRIGVKKAGTVRPIRVHLMNASDVQRVLSAAPKLRGCEGEFRTVYLAPDRTKEEQMTHAKLVKEMKGLIERDHSKYYYIRNNKINYINRVQSAN